MPHELTAKGGVDATILQRWAFQRLDLVAVATCVTSLCCVFFGCQSPSGYPMPLFRDSFGIYPLLIFVLEADNTGMESKQCIPGKGKQKGHSRCSRHLRR